MAKAKSLIVDDDQDIRRLLGHRLTGDGYEAVFAGDTIAAVTPPARRSRASSSSISGFRPGTGSLSSTTSS